MPTLAQLIPDIDTALALAPEELGHALLAAAKGTVQNGIFGPASVSGDQALFGLGPPDGAHYPRGSNGEGEFRLALAEAWHWLELNMLIMPAPGQSRDYKVFTRRGRELVDDKAAFRAYAAASQFPKALLHPTLRDDVWLELARGQYADAVFKAFRAVEEAVRAAGGYAPTDIGVALMREAFNHKKGPLRRESDPEPEREALTHLFAGAIGSYKNPHSHRTVTIEEAEEAREMVMLASHLLRIVDTRASAKATRDA